MIIKQSLKFLDTPSFCGEDMAMLFIGQAYEVSRAIIISNPIQVMHYPSTRQGLIVGFLPDKQVLADIASLICSGVFWKDNLYDLFMNEPHSDLFWEDMSHLRQEMPNGT